MVQEYKDLGEEPWSDAVRDVLKTTLLSDQAVGSNCKQQVLKELGQLALVPQAVFMEVKGTLLKALLQEFKTGEQLCSGFAATNSW
jgi:hypothetical protein